MGSLRMRLLQYLLEENTIMALKDGERYRCPNPNCACEIQVTKGAQPVAGGDRNPTYCCGKTMERV